MKAAVIPSTYQEWRHCIVVECGLELSPEYISARLSALNNAKDYYTQQFVKLYGREYLEQVLGWFSQAQRET